MNKKVYDSPVLELFFNDSEARLHIREIARQTGLHPNTVLRDAKMLSKEALLTMRRTRAVLEVNANIDNPRFTQLKRLHNLKCIILSGLVEFLNVEYSAPQAIILFGSYSRGEDVSKSDIDIAIVTQRRMALEFTRFEKLLMRHIQITEVDLKKIGKNLLANLANGIVLKGYLAL